MISRVLWTYSFLLFGEYCVRFAGLLEYAATGCRDETTYIFICSTSCSLGWNFFQSTFKSFFLACRVHSFDSSLCCSTFMFSIPWDGCLCPNYLFCKIWITSVWLRIWESVFNMGIGLYTSISLMLLSLILKWCCPETMILEVFLLFYVLKEFKKRLVLIFLWLLAGLSYEGIWF